jgi:hypothetical protein
MTMENYQVVHFEKNGRDYNFYYNSETKKFLATETIEPIELPEDVIKQIKERIADLSEELDFLQETLKAAIPT